MQKLKKLLLIIIPVLIVLTAGCTNIKTVSIQKSKSEKNIYFDKGVYKIYSYDKKNPYKNHLYVFYDELSGRTEENVHGIGLPFSCVQTDGYVKFRFGGIDEPEKVFKVKFAKNGVIIGFFENSSLIIMRKF